MAVTFQVSDVERATRPANFQAREDAREHMRSSVAPIPTGWINVLFPYVMNDPEAGTLTQNWATTHWRKGLNTRFGSAGGPSEDSIPSGLAAVPFKWNYLGTSFEMEFLGGFVGVAEDEGSLALRPAMGWAVRDAKSAGP
jgi:hypothetical protein